MRRGSFIVSRVCSLVLAVCLLGAALQACNRPPKPPDVGFLPTRAVPETDDPKVAFEDAKVACLEEARRKGISSVTRLLVFKGKISKSDYVECMEQKGYQLVDN
jgi:hypothetical protein